MGDWNLFFATAAGTAATLLGLLFVATQLHVEVFTDPTNRWTALAQTTLTMLSVVFILALFFLLPGLPLEVRGVVTVVISVFAMRGVVLTWWPVFGITERGRLHRISQSFWLLLVPMLGFAYLLLGALQLLLGQGDARTTIAGAFLSFFGVTVRNAWRLVVSVAKEPH
jgi:hypothetical protein